MLQEYVLRLSPISLHLNGGICMEGTGILFQSIGLCMFILFLGNEFGDELYGSC